MELLANHRIFQTNDLDLGRDFASRVWEKNDTKLKSDRYALTWNEVRLQRLSLSYVDHPCVVTARCEGPLSDVFHVLFHQKGRIDHTINGKPASSLNRQIVVHAPRQELTLDIALFSLLMLNLDGEFVRSALDGRVGKAPEFETWPVRFPGFRVGHRSSLVLRLGRSGTQVRKAEEWIDVNVSDAIGVEEIATAIGISPRALRSAFRRVRGYSPSNAILRRRLERSRAALAAAGPDDTGDQDCARAWLLLARAVRRAVPTGVWRKAIGDLGARSQPRTGSIKDYQKANRVAEPKLHSAAR